MMLKSITLKDNFWTDPTERVIDVYIPAGHNGRALPLLVDLRWLYAAVRNIPNWRNFTENVPEQADRLIANRREPPCVIAFPDCFTRLGGNQYINCPLGRWADFLIEEAVPFVEHNWAAVARDGAASRQEFGATAPWCTRCSFRISGRRRPAIRATWALSCCISRHAAPPCADC